MLKSMPLKLSCMEKVMQTHTLYRRRDTQWSFSGRMPTFASGQTHSELFSGSGMPWLLPFINISTKRDSFTCIHLSLQEAIAKVQVKCSMLQRSTLRIYHVVKEAVLISKQIFTAKRHTLLFQVSSKASSVHWPLVRSIHSGLLSVLRIQILRDTSQSS